MKHVYPKPREDSVIYTCKIPRLLKLVSSCHVETKYLIGNLLYVGILSSILSFATLEIVVLIWKILYGLYENQILALNTVYIVLFGMGILCVSICISFLIQIFITIPHFVIANLEKNFIKEKHLKKDHYTAAVLGHGEIPANCMFIVKLDKKDIKRDILRLQVTPIEKSSLSREMVYENNSAGFGKDFWISLVKNAFIMLAITGFVLIGNHFYDISLLLEKIL